LDKVITSKIRAILKPKPLDEIRDPEDKFESVDKIHAAAGVKIAAPGLEGVVAGAPFLAINDPSEAEKVRQEMQDELERVRIISDTSGVVLKADAIGSLEAIEGQLRAKKIPIRLADVGDVSKRDIVEAVTVAKSDPLLGTILAFGVGVLPDAKTEAQKDGVQIIEDKVIYQLIERYEEWAGIKREEVRTQRLEDYARPAKIAVKPGYVFRRSHPAIFGVNVLGGVLKPKAQLIDSKGQPIGTVREIQKEKKSVQHAKIGDELAVSVEGGVVGRNIQEGDVVYTDIPRNQVLQMKRELKDLLSGDELAVLDEIIAIKQREDSTYGIM
jgi:translation initiation factor 5B